MYILLDLSVSGQKLEVHQSPTIWTIHCVGHSKDVFGCIRKMGVAFPAEKFFAVLMEGAAHDNAIDTRNDADLLENVLDCDWEDAKERAKVMALQEMPWAEVEEETMQRRINRRSL